MSVAIRNTVTDRVWSRLANAALLLVGDITRAECIRLLVEARGWSPDGSSPQRFADVPPEHPDYGYIETAWHLGFITGYECGGKGEPCPGVYFRPAAKMTRAELCKWVILAFGLPIDTSGGAHFSDVPPDHPFYKFVEAARHHGLVKGYSDGTFRPNGRASTKQARTVLSRAIVVTPVPDLSSVNIRHMAFVPQDVSIAAGTSVRWTNLEEQQHTVTSDSGAWASQTLNQYDFYMFTFDAPGVYPYHCEIHPSMTGTITVEAAGDQEM